jgi:integrase/recombinase XerC
LALAAEDVDLERGEIRLHSTKGDRPEVVFLGPAIRAHLARYLVAHPSGPLITGPSGQPLTPRHVERRFREWKLLAGITRPASPHSLRHSFAMDLYRRTGDLALVKEALRHRNITSTLVYAHADQDRVRKALA